MLTFVMPESSRNQTRTSSKHKDTRSDGEGPTKPKNYCVYCLRGPFPTLKGLLLHISHTPQCRQARDAARSRIKPTPSKRTQELTLELEAELPNPDPTLSEDTPAQSQQPSVEEVEDEEYVRERFVRSYQLALGLDPWAPFEDEHEAELAAWLVNRVGKTVIEEFLKHNCRHVAALGHHIKAHIRCSRRWMLFHTGLTGSCGRSQSAGMFAGKAEKL